MKEHSAIIVLAFSLMLVASVAIAAEAVATPDTGKFGFFGTVAAFSAIGIAIAALETGIGMGLSISRAVEGIALNPRHRERS